MFTSFFLLLLVSWEYVYIRMVWMDVCCACALYNIHGAMARAASSSFRLTAQRSAAYKRIFVWQFFILCFAQSIGSMVLPCRAHPLAKRVMVMELDWMRGAERAVVEGARAVGVERDADDIMGAPPHLPLWRCVVRCCVYFVRTHRRHLYDGVGGRIQTNRPSLLSGHVFFG